MQEANKPDLSILAMKTTYSDESVESFEYKNKDKNIYRELIKIKPVSIHIKRLQWNDVIKKRFTSKYKISRPCVSQISRQLLNFGLKKKMKLIKNNHILKNTKVIISEESATETDSLPSRQEEYPSISSCKKIYSTLDITEFKMKTCEMLSNSAEPPLKKLKRNEHDDNLFIGFDSGCSPTKSLIKLKTVHLKKFKGFEPLKTKSGSLQSLSTRPVLCTNSDFSLKQMHITDSGKDSNAVGNSGLSKLSNSDTASIEVPSAQNVLSENVVLIGRSNHVINKSEVKTKDSNDSECIPVKYVHSPRNGDFCKKFKITKTMNCVARKHTSKPSIRCKVFKKHGPVSKVYVGTSTLNNFNNTPIREGDHENYHLKISVSKESEIVSESIIPIIPDESSDNDSEIDTISVCDSVKYLSSGEESKSESINYTKNMNGVVVNQCYSNVNQPFKSKSSQLQQDQFTDSDSETTIDSLGDVSSTDLCESSEEDSKSKDKPFIDFSKFLACNVNLISFNDEILENDNDIIYKSQSIQLKSDCQVKAYMLKASDITDTFCRNNQLSGISGFKIKQLLCTLIHLPRNNYGNFIIEVEEEEEYEEEETIKTPYFLTVPDPLTHSIFSVLIKRDMRKKYVPKLKLLDIVNRSLGVLNSSTNRACINIRPKPINFQNISGGYLISRSPLAPSNGTYVPISSSADISSVNSNYNRMTLIQPNPANPNFSKNMLNGGAGGLILFPNGMGTASGGTLLIQQPNNSSGFGVASSKFFFGQPTKVAPPPLTLGSDLVRPGIQGQKISLSQPPTLIRMKTQVDPIIELTVNQYPRPQNFQNSPIGHFQLPYVISKGPVDAAISCPNHKLELYQLESMLKTIVDNIKGLIRIGFPKNQTKIMNAVFQMLYSNNWICCKFHSISAANRDESLQNLLLTVTGSKSYQFIELPLPSPLQCHDLHPWKISNNDMFIVKRFVFAVDKSTRTIIYPLPPSCIPRENASIDKITVVIMVSPLRGVGPGLIVFPHSLLKRNLLLSLETTCQYTNIGKDWVLSAHQRGGLTQSMLLEYLDECALWVNQSSHMCPPTLAVDWWWCLEQKILSSTFKTLKVVNLHETYAPYKDPLEISIGVTMERMWGLLVRKFTQSVGPLTEANFPKFIIQVLKDLCAPHRLTAWCRSSGLYPQDTSKTEAYNKHITAII